MNVFISVYILIICEVFNRNQETIGYNCCANISAV